MVLRMYLKCTFSGFIFALCAVPSFAQTAPATSCFQPPALLASSDVASFLDTSSQLLVSFPAGGLDMANYVRSLAGSSSATIDPLLLLASTANIDQRGAIGAGLARAAAACVARDPEFAAIIQQKVALAGLSEVETAFLAASGDIATAALGTSGAATAGASQATGITSNGSAQGGTAGTTGDESTETATLNFASRGARSSSINNGGQSFTINNGGQSFTINNGGQSFTTIINAVSPN